jgi:hypothetical protein
MWATMGKWLEKEEENQIKQLSHSKQAFLFFIY